MNRVMLLGKLGFDPQLKKTPNGKSVCDFSLTTQEQGKDASKPISTFHRCVVWGQNAESAAKYLKAGSQVFIEGKLRTEKYQKNGVDMTITKIIVDQIKYLDSNTQQAETVLDDCPF